VGARGVGGAAEERTGRRAGSERHGRGIHRGRETGSDGTEQGGGKKICSLMGCLSPRGPRDNTVHNSVRGRGLPPTAPARMVALRTLWRPPRSCVSWYGAACRVPGCRGRARMTHGLASPPAGETRELHWVIFVWDKSITKEF
jgi:hypothetical protein